MAIVTKPDVKLGKDEKIQHVTGVYSKEITAKDLKKNPERHIRLYPTMYKNAKAILHELNTRTKKVTPIGDKNVVAQKKASNGVVYSILTKK